VLFRSYILKKQGGKGQVPYMPPSPFPIYQYHQSVEFSVRFHIKAFNLTYYDQS
jgi:hypothetical protein